MTAKRRVVVTGVGVVCPFGRDKKVVWESLCQGKSAIRQLQAFPLDGFEITIGGEVLGLDPDAYFGVREARRLDRFSQFAIVAADQAVAEAGLDMSKENPKRVGCIIGTGIGGLNEIETQHNVMIKTGVFRVSPLMIPKLMCNAAAGVVSIRLGLMGPSMSVSSACASGSNAIGEALEVIRNGVCDVMIGGGSEAAITPMGLAGFQNIKALSKRNNDPERASRPFDKGRDGFVMAEGAGVFVLEELEHARKRGANILCELIGYGSSSDACHITKPEPDGRGACDAMKAALDDAEVSADEIDYINAHGTSTPAGDDIEAKAILKMFGERARSVPISSTKSMIGHLLGASGAVEGVVCVWTLLHDVITPTINLDNPDPECCGLDFVPHQAREAHVRTIMNNSFGFGGHNVGLILRRFEG